MITCKFELYLEELLLIVKLCFLTRGRKVSSAHNFDLYFFCRMIE